MKFFITSLIVGSRLFFTEGQNRKQEKVLFIGVLYICK